MSGFGQWFCLPAGRSLALRCSRNDAISAHFPFCHNSPRNLHQPLTQFLPPSLIESGSRPIISLGPSVKSALRRPPICRISKQHHHQPIHCPIPHPNSQFSMAPLKVGDEFPAAKFRYIAYTPENSDIVACGTVQVLDAQKV